MWLDLFGAVFFLKTGYNPVMRFSTFHCHTVYSDGKNTIDEMIRAAVEKNFRAIGISDHGPITIPCSCNMKSEDFSAYRDEIRTAAERYRSLIDVRFGLECDWLKECQPIGYYDAFPTDYRIGSVHFIKCGEEWLPIDKSADLQLEIAERYYNGDRYAMVLDYYCHVEEMTAAGGFDILGHIDLVCKFNENNALFDEESDLFEKPVSRILEAAADNRIAVEINTGAIGRGYRTRPYPSLRILKECRKRKLPVYINSDAHCQSALDCFYEESLRMARECGYIPDSTILRPV